MGSVIPITAVPPRFKPVRFKYQCCCGTKVNLRTKQHQLAAHQQALFDLHATCPKKRSARKENR